MQRKCKTRHDWVGKVIHSELCKKLKFEHTTKQYSHKPESVLENETHKILWDFAIQTDNWIPTRRPDWVIINKKRKKKKKEKKRAYRKVDFAFPANHRVKIKEKKKTNKYFNLARELIKLWNMKVTVIPIVIGALGMVPKEGWNICKLEDEWGPSKRQHF